MHISALTSYPIKSCAGIGHASIQLTPTGLEGDRSWMLIGPQGRFVSARQFNRMLLIRPQESSQGILIKARGMLDLEIPFPEKDQAVQVEIWKDQLQALDAGDEASQWLSDFLGTDCRLVYGGEATTRKVNAPSAGPDHTVLFADSSPLLIISEASLEALNGKLGESFAMTRFRPNIVITGGAAYAEDGWRRIRIGEVELFEAKPCVRCTLTTIDPVTAMFHPGREPLASLKKLRMLPGEGAVFGKLFIPESTGLLNVGDTLSVTDWV